MNDKAVGYSLVGIGIAIMIGALFSLYLVFTHKAEPLQVFNLPGISIDASTLVPQNSMLERTQDFIGRSNAPAPKIEMFPAVILNTLLNTIAHVVFMGFIVTIGFRIASIGTMLARTIVVHVRAKNNPDTPNEAPHV